MRNKKDQESPEQTPSQSITAKVPSPRSEKTPAYYYLEIMDRLVTVHEEDHKNAREMRKKGVEIIVRGQILAFIIALLSIGAVFLSIFLKQPAMSIPPTIIALTGLAAVFVSKKNRSK